MRPEGVKCIPRLTAETTDGASIWQKNGTVTDCGMLLNLTNSGMRKMEFIHMYAEASFWRNLFVCL